MEDEFNPNGIKVYWHKDGVPYIILNKKLLDCQHGKYRRPLPNGEKKIGQPIVTPEGVVKYKVTKKLNCPAQIVLREILRFPDFKVVENTQWMQKVQSKCLKKAFKSSQDLTSHRCFVVNLPKIEDHENHVIEPASVHPVLKKKYPRLKEIIHPKIFEKIKELSIEGISEIKNIKEIVSTYVNEELSAEEDIKSLTSRRFNPRYQDIRNIVKMIENDLRKEGSSLAKVQCTSVIKDLETIVSHVQNEKYLEQLKVHLDYIRATMKAEKSLDALLACHKSEPSAKRAKVNAVDQEASTYPYTIDDTETQMLYDDMQGEVTRIYYYE
ncbi:hypothetical protein SK128_015286 [Halocaridina rubra]|uniref:Uncharacterized protein n=1 Tax=Halocaridina rubra TaxID=373956 RepID=A0AAN9FWI4_HALRR